MEEIDIDFLYSTFLCFNKVLIQTCLDAIVRRRTKTTAMI